jgi:phenylalanyl-tRNA synthetase alpha chain
MIFKQIAKMFSSKVYPSPSICILGNQIKIESEYYNLAPSLISKLNIQLYKQPNHPIALIFSKLRQILEAKNFSIFQDFNPVVTVKQNFDDLLFPPDHIGRRKSDTYFISKTHLLRTHTTVHDVEALKTGAEKVAIIGQVFRRDSIDKIHFPIFHQLDLVKLFDSSCSEVEIVNELKADIILLLSSLFGEKFQFRWSSSYFPFTQPSLELEILHQGTWIEILGCGILRPEIIQLAQRTGKKAYAAGIGLERIAMILLQIPDIRFFWSTNELFLSQWSDGKLRNFVSFSKYPSSCRDISFWISNSAFDSNSFHEIVREEGGDLVQQVTLVDEFECQSEGKKSKTFRIVYQSPEKTLLNTTVNEIQERIRASCTSTLGVELR